MLDDSKTQCAQLTMTIRMRSASLQDFLHEAEIINLGENGQKDNSKEITLLIEEATN